MNLITWNWEYRKEEEEQERSGMRGILGTEKGAEITFPLFPAKEESKREMNGKRKKPRVMRGKWICMRSKMIPLYI
jgi:hypothetical protein